MHSNLKTQPSACSNSDDSRLHKIFEAAGRVIPMRGIPGTRMSDIAKRAGLAKGTLYLRFESKEDLLTALVDEAIDHMRSGPMPDTRSGEPLVKAILQQFIRALETERVRVAIMIVKHRSVKNPALIYRFFRDLSYGFQTALDRALETEKPVTSILSSTSLLRWLFLNSVFYANVQTTRWLETEARSEIFALVDHCLLSQSQTLCTSS
ncbi:MAG: helix-turn-helix domain-containing protein [Pseudomonadota bacterium]